MNRRQFLQSTLSAGAVTYVGVSAPAAAAWAARSPIKIAHREGNMLRTSSSGVYELAAKIPGISGIEVQTTRSNLWDRETVLAYKRESHRWNIRTISMGGSLPAGGTLLDAARASSLSGRPSAPAGFWVRTSCSFPVFAKRVPGWMTKPRTGRWCSF